MPRCDSQGLRPLPPPLLLLQLLLHGGIVFLTPSSRLGKSRPPELSESVRMLDEKTSVLPARGGRRDGRRIAAAQPTSPTAAFAQGAATAEPTGITVFVLARGASWLLFLLATIHIFLRRSRGRRKRRRLADDPVVRRIGRRDSAQLCRLRHRSLGIVAGMRVGTPGVGTPGG